MSIDDERMKKFLDNMEERIKWSKENGCKLLDCKTIDSNIELRRENIKLRNENKDLKDKLEIQGNLTETWKKIAEKLADEVLFSDKAHIICRKVGKMECEVENIDICKQCIIDWARNEVEYEK